jgi:hypothetical protein
MILITNTTAKFLNKENAVTIRSKAGHSFKRNLFSELSNTVSVSRFKKSTPADCLVFCPFNTLLVVP